LRVYYAEKGDVEAQRRRVQVRADLAGGELKVGLRYQSPFPYRYLRVLFHLQVPQETALAVANREGDTIIKEAGKEIRISQENGNLFLEKLRSRLDLRLRNCNANLKDIADHAEINASHGSLTVENAVSLRLDGQHGECRLQNVEKDVVVEYSFGKLTVDGAGKVEINSRHCDISVRNVRDGAVISNKFERVVLENVSGDVRLSGRSSPIVLRQAKAGNVVIENSYADTSIQDFSGKSLDVLLKNGNLVLGVASVDERINVQAQNAELDLTFAILADPTFNIKNQHGRIIADPALGLETFTENEENFANRAGQKPEIFINNSYGDVRVRTAK